MKPIELVMSAFGSYGREERIDFSNLAGELFLITGDTGAGKTTIFDGIMYALYGKTSGGEREGAMMRSQFAASDRKTFVRFTFSYGKQVYKVERNPEYSMDVTLKNGTVKSRKVAQNVELTLPDGSVFLGKKAETDGKLEEIIGLTAEQFTQMAMIAQGDFLKLIYAKSDERKKIFTKLFGTGFYNRIQEALRRQSSALDDAIAENKRASLQEFARKMRPEGFVEIEDVLDKTSVDIVRAYLDFGGQKEKELECVCKEIKKEEQNLAEKIAKGELLEKTFLLLERAKGKKQELEEQKDVIIKYEKDLKRAKQAETVAALEEQKKKAVTVLGSVKKELRELEKGTKELQISLECYEAVQRWLNLRGQELKIKDLETRLKEYEKEENKLKSLADAWDKAAQESQLASEAYNRKYRIFLQEQAGILAETLVSGEPCPVCGSKNHPVPAKLSEEAVSEAEVNLAKQKRDVAEKNCGEAEKAYRLKEQNRKLLWQQLEADFMEQLKAMPGTKTEAQSVLQTVKADGDIAMQQSVTLFYQDKNWSALVASCKENTKKIHEKAVLEAEEKYQKLLAKEGRIQGEAEAIRARIAQLEVESKEADISYKEGILTAGFVDEEEYRNGKCSIEQQKALEAAIKKYEVDCQQNAGELKSLKEQVRGKKPVEMADLRAVYQETEKKRKNAERTKQDVHIANVTNKAIVERLKGYGEQLDTLQREDAVVKLLFKTANGRLTQSVKMDFETYIQRQYFRQIIRQANKRFLVMTGQQFMLQIKEEMTGKGKNEGLDLQVYSLVTGKTRDIKTLSGGESFLAALSMALGLSDIVKQNAGGIHLDMMFIDEGFGSLDTEARKKAIEVLAELSGKNRMIGIISHVTELKEQLDKKLLVTRNEKGSSICWENS